ncbi:MAG: pantetheine-phosphate adenylyltransferase [Candidatus Omnitrophica bacterium 4484_171]|nr:MAG: pantetheine-phosphate adenylyltransferase [Candidatus Omnitrophica bacterium 4484_171]
MKRAIYPGTFDPITFGHVDIIKRASLIFDKIIVAVVKNSFKDTLFSYEERVNLLKKATKGIKKIEVEGFEGLVVDFAVKKNINVIIRGLRMISDFEYEFQMALTNRKLSSRIETIFLMPHAGYSYLSSRLVKEIASLGGNLDDFLPRVCVSALNKKIGRR